MPKSEYNVKIYDAKFLVQYGKCALFEQNSKILKNVMTLKIARKGQIRCLRE